MERLDAGEGEKVNVNTGRLQAVARAAEEANEHPEPLTAPKPQPATGKKAPKAP